MDEKMFDDFLKANKKELGADLVEESTTFFNRLKVANRLYKAAFGHIPADPQTPGELHGTMMMLKLQQEVMGSDK